MEVDWFYDRSVPSLTFDNRRVIWTGDPVPDGSDGSDGLFHTPSGDLIVANWAASSEIYLNDGSGFFSLPSSDEFRRAVHYGSSVALADYDIDGDLDFVIGNWPNHPGEGLEENVLIENRFADGNWLRVTLEGVTSNRSAIGARIELVTRADGESLLQVREVSAHSGWRSQNDLTQHFGLGSAAAVESLTVYWPSGAIQNVVVDGVNKRVSIIEE